MTESLSGQFQPIGWSLETDTSQMKEWLCVIKYVNQWTSFIKQEQNNSIN